MIATVNMFNGDVFYIENPKNDLTIIHAISDEYKVSPSDINLKHLGEDNYLGWMDVSPSYSIEVIYNDQDVLEKVYDSCNREIFWVNIYHVDDRDVPKFEFIIMMKKSLAKNRMWFSISDHFDTEVLDQRVSPLCTIDDDEFISYKERYNTIWYRSLYDCISENHRDIPEEALSLLYQAQHRIYMYELLHNELMYAIIQRETRERENRGVCTCYESPIDYSWNSWGTCNACKPLDGIFDLFATK